jgi:hypothetical protein
MKTGAAKYILAVVLLFTVLFTAELGAPKPVDWTETYAAEDKIPYGSYIVFKQIQELNGGKGIKRQEKTPYLYIDNAEKIAGGKSTLLIITSQGSIDEYEWDKLIEYAKRGNTVFISSEYFNNYTLEDIGIQAMQYPKYFSKDSVLYAKLVNPKLKADRFTYPFKENVTYFEVDTNPDKNLTILGVLNDSLVNFVQYTCGNGKVLLHTNPKMYSNMYLLKGDNYKHTFNTLSYLPPQTILWDEFYKAMGENSGSVKTGSPLSYVLGQPAFRWAFYLVLSGIGLFFIFRTKRRQRPIPIIEPLANTSLEFTRTIGQLYFNKGNHADIAAKKVQHLIQFIYTRYYLRFDFENPEFAILLAEKSGVAEKDVRFMYYLIVTVRKTSGLTPDRVLELSKVIDNFYKKAN